LRPFLPPSAGAFFFPGVAADEDDEDDAEGDGEAAKWCCTMLDV
jgi:hypothetical protein